jgi:hypothetical protein
MAWLTICTKQVCDIVPAPCCTGCGPWGCRYQRSLHAAASGSNLPGARSAARAPSAPVESRGGPSAFVKGFCKSTCTSYVMTTHEDNGSSPDKTGSKCNNTTVCTTLSIVKANPNLSQDISENEFVGVHFMIIPPWIGNLDGRHALGNGSRVRSHVHLHQGFVTGDGVAYVLALQCPPPPSPIKCFATSSA